ncbi:WD40 repeat-containing protein [Reticulomyxa filosa]|uniref:WD40 repeat-containing protein n=1 Tax=Reticulomyxa filosa TaxID=46433 RepID=X6NFL7_RETFI|nr:WD40 repeat-containing protein [Reticulomyxa filosa]|eukprot:ETO24766.1 WD40 repeat-containing protein [Reticulomyxa filosa]
MCKYVTINRCFLGLVTDEMEHDMQEDDQIQPLVAFGVNGEDEEEYTMMIDPNESQLDERERMVGLNTNSKQPTVDNAFNISNCNNIYPSPIRDANESTNRNNTKSTNTNTNSENNNKKKSQSKIDYTNRSSKNREETSENNILEIINFAIKEASESKHATYKIKSGNQLMTKKNIQHELHHLESQLTDQQKKCTFWIKR